MSQPQASQELPRDAVIVQFRSKYHEFDQRLQHMLANPTDSFLWLQLLEQLDEFSQIVDQVSYNCIVCELTVIDPTFLQFSHSLRTTTAIAHFLGVGRTTVRRELLEQGLVQPGPPPANFTYDSDNEEPEDEPEDDLLDPDLPVPLHIPSDIPPCQSWSHSDISDEDLDALIVQIRSHFRRAGRRILHGILQSLGYRIQFKRIRQSLLRIDPVHRIFDRIRIRRRGYTVAGPNSLWHHDGQHGALSVHRNQILVHNVRIERLWVDVTAQVGHTWTGLFDILELRHGLDADNQNHLWLIHYLFLVTINDHLALFAQGWNEHRISTRAVNRSPIDMFTFDSYVNGVRGHALDLNNDELEVYGIDWDGLNLDEIRESQRRNNPQGEDSTSWVGRTGPPPHLNEVQVEPPMVDLAEDSLSGLYNEVEQWLGRTDDNAVISAWSFGLAYCRRHFGNEF
ncbi:hypothetical protein C8J56DRAFT_771085 [Mycena floridula]|nr:hypothetical protein C8J56DRAFT_808764 [Mycena floridula]KAJ7598581.1 hypothetical protein C8J56DRAFT_771085 [Mycena floridula]